MPAPMYSSTAVAAVRTANAAMINMAVTTGAFIGEQPDVVEHGDLTAAQFDDAAFGQVAQCLGGGLMGGADQGRELLVGEGDRPWPERQQPWVCERAAAGTSGAAAQGGGR